MAKFLNKIYTNQKAPQETRPFGVDRGGVEPLEQGDNPAPGTVRTRPSSTEILYQRVCKMKSPLARALRSQTFPIKAGLSPVFIISIQPILSRA